MDDLENIPKADRPPMPFLKDTWQPWEDYAKVDADLDQGNVSAPAELVPALEQITSDAQSQGVDLKIVFTQEELPVAAWGRDLAVRLSQDHAGTIVVFTPDAIGSQSDSISRAKLESAQDDAYREGDPIAAAAVYEHKVTTPAPPWGLITGAVIIVMLLAVVAFVLALRRRTRG
ncbi:Rv1476 family membrane protein [Dietzia sp.]|uniref:Rv1476 family membrane protein n=1 Tax=Dietzia sp. TaxID=1871616 RepID=UPI002FDA5EC3